MSGASNAAAMVAALSSAAAGFTALSLAMDRHWEALHGRGNVPRDGQRRLLRWAGSGGLLISLLVCLFIWGAAQGWVAWAGVLTASAFALVLTLCYAAHAIVRIGWAAAFVSVVALAAMLGLLR